MAVQQGHLAAVECLRAGMSELEFAAAIENGQRLAGHDGVFFMRGADFAMAIMFTSRRSFFRTRLT